MFKRSVSMKLASATVVSTIMTFLIGAAGVYAALLLQGTLKSYRDESVAPIEQVVHTNEQLQETMRQLLMAFVHNPATEAAKFHNHPTSLHVTGVEKAIENVQRSLSVYRSLPNHIARSEAADAYSKSIENYVRTAKDLTELARTDTPESLTQLGVQLTTRLMPAFNKARTAGEQLFIAHKKRAVDIETDAGVTFKSTKYGLIATCVLSALFALVVVGLISRGLTGAIRSLSRDMGAIANGKLDLEVSAAERKDEIGLMGRAVMVFRNNAVAKAKLEADAAAERKAAEQARASADAERVEAARKQTQVVKSLAAALANLAKADVSDRLHNFPSEYEGLQADFNAAMEALCDLLASVSTNSDAILSGIGEINTAADDLARRTELQAAGLEETAAALDQITASSAKAAQNATHARDVVSGTRNDAELASQVMRKAVGAMSGIESSASQVTQIVGVIDEIAFQTNLLALNAGVEAARAGDAGRGFAVVASEVRALAQRSATAAKEIKALISSSSVQVAEGVGLVGEAGSALEGIMTKINEIDRVVSGIAAGIGEQASELAQVNTAVAKMDQTTQQNAAVAEESKAATVALSHAAETLAALIGNFKIGGDRQGQSPQPLGAALRRAA